MTPHFFVPVSKMSSRCEKRSQRQSHQDYKIALTFISKHLNQCHRHQDVKKGQAVLDMMSLM